MTRRVGVGVGVVIHHRDRVLMVQRRHRFPGSWSFPGGYLDFGETLYAAAMRETAEETGLTVEDPVYLGISNDQIDDERHNVTVWFEARGDSADCQNNAPDELMTVAWFPRDRLPAPLFPSTANFVRGLTYPPNLWPHRSPTAGEGAEADSAD